MSNPFVAEHELLQPALTLTERAEKAVQAHMEAHARTSALALHFAPTWEKTIEDALREHEVALRAQFEREHADEVANVETRTLENLSRTMLQLAGQARARAIDARLTNRKPGGP